GALMYIAYGYDAQGHVVCCAFFQTEVNPRSYTYYQYGPDRVDFAEFAVAELYTDRYRLHKVGRLVYGADKKPLHYANYSQTEGQDFREFEEYDYDESSRLVRVALTWQTRPRPFSPETVKRIERMQEQQREIARMFLTDEESAERVARYEELIEKAAQP